jgi:hypothetical protein
VVARAWTSTLPSNVRTTRNTNGHKYETPGKHFRQVSRSRESRGLALLCTTNLLGEKIVEDRRPLALLSTYPHDTAEGSSTRKPPYTIKSVRDRRRTHARGK